MGHKQLNETEANPRKDDLILYHRCWRVHRWQPREIFSGEGIHNRSVLSTRSRSTSGICAFPKSKTFVSIAATRKAVGAFAMAQQRSTTLPPIWAEWASSSIFAWSVFEAF